MKRKLKEEEGEKESFRCSLRPKGESSREVEGESEEESMQASNEE